MTRRCFSSHEVLVIFSVETMLHKYVEFRSRKS